MSRRPHTLVLAGLAALGVFGLSACGSTDGSAHAVAPVASTASATVTASATSTPTPTPTPAPVAAAPAAPVAGGRGAGTGGGAAPAPAPAAGGSNTSGGGGGGGTSAPAPKVTSFKVKQPPTCPVHGTPDAPFSSPGSPVVIAWTVTGAGGAAIAVDNPGTYGAYGSDYPASGSLSLPFGCTDGTTTTHTYTVWPAGAKNVSKTISVSAHSDN